MWKSVKPEMGLHLFRVPWTYAEKVNCLHFAQSIACLQISETFELLPPGLLFYFDARIIIIKIFVQIEVKLVHSYPNRILRGKTESLFNFSF